MVATVTAAPAIDTLGLVVLKHGSVLREEYRNAEGITGPSCYEPTIERFEILPGETVGQLLARVGLDEGDRIEIRFPTVAEDTAKLAEIVTSARDRRIGTLETDGLDDAALAARIALLQSIADEAEGPDEDLSGAGYTELYALQDEQERREQVWRAARRELLAKHIVTARQRSNRQIIGRRGVQVTTLCGKPGTNADLMLSHVRQMSEIDAQEQQLCETCVREAQRLEAAR